MRFKDTSFLLASGVLTNLFGVVTGILLARALGPEGRGEVANYVFWPAFLAGLLGLSLNVTATFHVARLSGMVRARAEASLRAIILPVALIMAPIGYLVLLAIDQTRFLTPIGVLALVYVFAEIVRPAVLGIDAGRRDYLNLAIFRLLTPVLYLASIVSFAQFGGLSVADAVMSVVAASVITITFRLVGGLKSGQRSKLFSREILKSSLRYHPPQVLELIKNNFDRLVIVLFLPAEQVGLYFVAYTFASAPYVAVQQAFTSQLLTEFSSNKSRAGVWQSMIRAFLITGLAALALLLILVLVLPFAVPLLTGPGYEAVPTLSSILALAFMVRMFVSIVVTYLQSIRATLLLVTIEISYIAGFLAAALIVSPIDARGVAYCVLVGFVVTGGSSVLVLIRASVNRTSERATGKIE